MIRNKEAITKIQAIIIAAVIIIALIATSVYYLTISPTPGSAEISGKVTDSSTGEPIAGATVTCDGYKASTGPDGVYYLTVPTGSYTLTISMEDYDASSKSVTATEAKTYTVDASIAKSTAPEPKYGGTFVMADDIEPASLSPLTSFFQRLVGTTLEAVFEKLVDPDPEGGIVPHLATSWEQPDNYTFIFHLREGVVFHDGTPFDAYAVAKNFKFYKETSGSQRKPDIDHWEVLNDYTIKLVYSIPAHWKLLDWAWWAGMVSPTAYEELGEEGFARHPVGTGPFKFVEWVPGDHITLERFDDYWGEKPYLDRIILKVIPEGLTRMLEFEAGNLDALPMSALYPHIARLNASGRYKFVISGSVSQRQYKFNLLRSPFGDNKLLRKAISYAVDREAIAKGAYYGYAYPSVAIIRYGYEPYYNPQARDPDLVKYTYDPEKAEELLDEAGYPRGPDGVRLRTKLLTAHYSNWDVIATILQEQLSKVGIEAEIELVEKAIQSERTYALMDYDTIVISYGGRGDYAFGWLYHMHSKHIPKGGMVDWNYMGINDTRIDELVDELEVTSIATNPERIAEIVAEIQKIELEEAYVCRLVDPLILDAVQPNVFGYTVHPWHPKLSILCNEALGVNTWISD